MESFNRVLLSWCSATPRCTRSSPASRTAWRSTTSPWRAPSRNSWCDLLGQRRGLGRRTASWSRRCSWAAWCQHPFGRPCPVHLQGPGRHDDHLVAYQLVRSPARAFPCLTKARCRSSPFLVFRDTAFECAQKTRKEARCPSSSFL